MIKAIFFDWGNISVKGFKDKDKELNGILKPLGFIWKKFNPIWNNFYTLIAAGKIKTDGELEIFNPRSALFSPKNFGFRFKYKNVILKFDLEIGEYVSAVLDFVFNNRLNSKLA